MPIDTLTTVVDDVNDNLATYHMELVNALNKVMPSSAYAGYASAVSMTGNVTLTDASLPVLSYSPTAARDLTLPAVATTNHPFYVINRSSTYDITVKNAGGTVVATVAAEKTMIFLSDGSNDWSAVGGGGEAGGLVYTPTTVTTGNVTAVNGNLYACTIAGLTADRDFNLPTPAAAGERIGVFILDGDDTYELIVKANAVEITRLFIQREYLTLISTGTGAGDWKIEVDGRIPCIAILERQAAQNINTSSATKIAFDTVNTNRGDMGDVTTNDRINIRRTSTYVVSGFVSISAVLDDQEFLEAELYLNGSIHKFKRDYVSRATANNFASPEAISRRTFSAGDYLELYLFHTEGAAQDTDTTYYPTLAAIEVL